jgi:hypothetical protein
MLPCRDEVGEVMDMNEGEAAPGCHNLVVQKDRYGSVIAAVKKLQLTLPPGYRGLTLWPDRGGRYLDTVYNGEWIGHFALSTTQSRRSLSYGLEKAERQVSSSCPQHMYESVEGVLWRDAVRKNLLICSCWEAEGPNRQCSTRWVLFCSALQESA